MKKLLFLYIFLVFPGISLAEGRMYENKKEPHCTLWDTMRLKWPQTIMGREKIKCRRRAALSNTTPVTCRFKSWKWNDDDPTQRMCTYVKQDREWIHPRLLLLLKIKVLVPENINVLVTNNFFLNFILQKYWFFNYYLDYYQ